MTNLEKKIIKPKLGLLELAKQLGNVSEACKTLGYSRDTFYRYRDLEFFRPLLFLSYHKFFLPQSKIHQAQNLRYLCLKDLNY